MRRLCKGVHGGLMWQRSSSIAIPNLPSHFEWRREVQKNVMEGKKKKVVHVEVWAQAIKVERLCHSSTCSKCRDLDPKDQRSLKHTLWSIYDSWRSHAWAKCWGNCEERAVHHSDATRRWRTCGDQGSRIDINGKRRRKRNSGSSNDEFQDPKDP